MKEDFDVMHDELDSVIVTNEDFISQNNQHPLSVLHYFLNKFVKNTVSTICLISENASQSDYLNNIEINELSKDYDLFFNGDICCNSKQLVGKGDSSNDRMALSSLTLFTFMEQDSRKLSDWINRRTSSIYNNGEIRFNTLATHEGIEIHQLDNILSEEESQMLMSSIIERGGYIEYNEQIQTENFSGELCFNYMDALCSEEMTIYNKTNKFLATQSILLSLQGVPCIYLHSLLGSQNVLKGFEEYNRKQERINIEILEEELEDHTSLRHHVFHDYLELLYIRKQQPAFGLNAVQEVIQLGKSVFALLRHNEETEDRLLYVVNVTDSEQTLNTEYVGMDIISNEKVKKIITLKPYQFRWIKL